MASGFQERRALYVSLGRHRSSGKNYVAECPACAKRGQDRRRHHLSVLKSDPGVYRCWLDCSPEEIKRALGIDPHDRIVFTV